MNPAQIIIAVVIAGSSLYSLATGSTQLIAVLSNLKSTPGALMAYAFALAVAVCIWKIYVVYFRPIIKPFLQDVGDAFQKHLGISNGKDRR